ncbi:hypothetical protein CYMTET_46543 [Cymbomonas tetramitiformis]|uniref:NFD4 C-terminal domain-containing protein n=1 Tax=Cymbomonas tetramitiformis TaxID=36881 RepID=A0AAE0EX64_9CHLO|nr:hypothetical protein CYMTET_46543 [Cymbomonas tetramitiformis]
MACRPHTRKINREHVQFYSGALKKRFDLKQNQLETIGIMLQMNGLVAFLPGLLYDARGARFTITLGGCIMLLGYTLLWAIGKEYIPIANDVYTLVGAYENSGRSSSPGLDFLLVMAAYCGLCTLIPAQFIRKFGGAPRGIRRQLLTSFSIIVLLAVAVTISALLQHQTISTSVSLSFLTVITSLFLMPFVIPSLEGPFKPGNSFLHPCQEQLISGGASGELETTDTFPEPLLEAASSDLESSSLTLSEMVRTVDCWLLLFSSVVIVGAGVMVTTNLGQMCESRGAGSAATAVSLFSASQALGRLFTGLISEVAMRRRVSRPLFLAVASAIMALGHMLLLVPELFALYGGVMLCGYAFGMVWPILVVVCSELFGSLHMGSNYMLYDGGGNALGALMLAKFLPQTIYQAHVAHGEKTCYGQACFSGSHLVLIALNMASIASALFLTLRNRSLYQRLWDIYN